MRARQGFFLSITTIAAGNSIQIPLGEEICPWSSLLPHPEHHLCSPSDGLRLLSETAKQNPTQPAQISVEDDGPNADRWTAAHDCVDQFCVYSNDGFFGRGIAVVTNPQAHQHIVQSQSPTTYFKAGKPKYRVIKTQGKGDGLIANDTIRRGELIKVAKPALLVHQAVLGGLDLEDLYELIDAAVDSLPEARKASYLAQSGQMGGHKTIDILFTNSYQMNVGEHFHYGNFPDASLFNHDCRPNLAFYIDQTLTYHAHAIRDIEPGEELTVSYLDPFQLRSARQERAQQTLGFTCICPLCSSSHKEVAASDARLLLIQRIEGELADFSSQEASPALIEKLIALYEEEHLDFKMAGAYTIAALNYNLFGQAQLAQKYAKLAVEAGRLENGPDAPDVRAMQELLDNPTGHWSWNLKPYKQII
ncbi:hypothetical protein F5X99DRAFT_374124 [Biscogniauxia marginata]|nr:hypothetical protein F5X99DRAFT_374124 [Biscogniauxia marginata]